MVSLKTKTRATITTLTVAALATAIFTGCAPSTPNSSDQTSVPINSGSTSMISENSTPGGDGGTGGTPDDDSGIKFKYWYENNKDSISAGTDDTATGDTLFGSEKLPIYEDKDGKKYVGSDFKHISVDAEGKINPKDTALLRDSEDFKIYLMNADAVMKDGFTMPSFEDLQADDLASGSVELIDEDAATALLYVNGIFAGVVQSPSQIDLSSIFSVAANIGNVSFKDNTAVVSFGTAVDVITATFAPQEDNTILVTYDMADTKITVPSQSVSYAFDSTSSDNNYLRLSPEYIEKVLGYHIISSTAADGTLELNVITDTKDELKPGNAIDPKDAAEQITGVDVPSTPSTPSESDNTSEPASSSSDSNPGTPVESKPEQSTASESKPTPSSSSTPSSSTPVESKPAEQPSFNSTNPYGYSGIDVPAPGTAGTCTPEEYEEMMRLSEENWNLTGDALNDGSSGMSKEDLAKLDALLGI